MKAIVKRLLFPHYFIRIGQEFLVMESAFLYMMLTAMIATLRVAYEAKHDLLLEDFSVTVIRIVCYLPFLFGVFMFIYSYFKPNVKHIDDGEPHWRTQLKLLKSPLWKMGQRTQYEKMKMRDLEDDWLFQYDESFDDMKYIWFHKYQPLLLPVLCGIVFAIFS